MLLDDAHIMTSFQSLAGKCESQSAPGLGLSGERPHSRGTDHAEYCPGSAGTSSPTLLHWHPEGSLCTGQSIDTNIYITSHSFLTSNTTY